MGQNLTHSESQSAGHFYFTSTFTFFVWERERNSWFNNDDEQNMVGWWMGCDVMTGRCYVTVSRGFACLPACLVCYSAKLRMSGKGNVNWKQIGKCVCVSNGLRRGCYDSRAKDSFIGSFRCVYLPGGGKSLGFFTTIRPTRMHVCPTVPFQMVRCVLICAI